MPHRPRPATCGGHRRPRRRHDTPCPGGCRCLIASFRVISGSRAGSCLRRSRVLSRVATESVSAATVQRVVDGRQTRRPESGCFRNRLKGAGPVAAAVAPFRLRRPVGSVTLTTMTRTVSAAEAKAHFSDHLRASERGESIVITRHGKPVAALVSARDLPELERLRAAGPAAGLVSVAGGWAGSDTLVKRVRDVVRSRPRRAPRFG